MNGLIEFDRALFEKINGAWTHPWLDATMPIVTDLHRSGPWPFVLLAIALALWLFRQRAKAAKTIVLIVLSVALSDMISYRAIKHWIERPRPEFSGVDVHLRTNSHGGPSFPSNHSANNFAAATILAYSIAPIPWFWFAIAAAVGFSRIYVGVHFPLDVLGGALLGVTVANLVWHSFGRKWLRKSEDGATLDAHTNVGMKTETETDASKPSISQ